MKKKLKAIILAILIVVILSACSSETETPSFSAFPTLPPINYSETPSETPSEPQNTADTESLTLFVFYGGTLENYFINHLAQEFIKQNPGTEIIIKDYFANNHSMRSSDIRGAIEEIYGEKGPDIIQIPNLGNFSPQDWRIEYADLDLLMAQDEKFNKDNYFMNILDPLYEDGKLYIMPLGIFPYYYSLNKQYLNTFKQLFGDINTINSRQILDLYEGAAILRGSTENLYLFDFPASTTGINQTLELASLKPGDRANFKSSPDNVELLRRWLSIPDMSNSLYENIRDGKVPPTDVETVFTSYVGYNWHVNFDGYLDYPDSLFTMPMGLADSNGKVLYTVTNSLSINETCTNKALAWEFIKFCAGNPLVSSGDGAQSFRPALYPISRSGLAAGLEETLQGIYDLYESQGRFPSKQENQAIEDAVERMIALMESCGQCDQYYRVFEFDTPLTDYRVNRITFEQLVERIESTVRSWAE